MKNISLTLQVHQPVRLKRYRFFDIGNETYYYDDYENERIIRKSAEEFYLPNNNILLDILKKYKGQFKVTFSISGTSFDLFSLYAPEVISSFQQLSATGCVEFLGETFSHSLASLKYKNEFRSQVEAHTHMIEELFGQKTCVFKNTELIYSNEIGEMAAEMGFKAVLTAASGNITEWRGPNYLYSNPINPDLKILLKNRQLSRDIDFMLSNSKSTDLSKSESNYIAILNKFPDEERVVNVLIDYEIVGEGKMKRKGMSNFLKSFPHTIYERTHFRFKTLSEIADEHVSISDIDIPDHVIRSDKFAGLTSLQENELQQDALEKLYNLKDRIDPYTDLNLWKDWQYLQSSDHFYYMSSRFFSERDYQYNLNPYENPYEAFMNYMNVLSDFTIRLNNIPVRNKYYNPLIFKSKKEITCTI